MYFAKRERRDHSLESMISFSRMEFTSIAIRKFHWLTNQVVLAVEHLCTNPQLSSTLAVDGLHFGMQFLVQCHNMTTKVTGWLEPKSLAQNAEVIWDMFSRAKNTETQKMNATV
jgi:hypothetical protein